MKSCLACIAFGLLFVAVPALADVLHLKGGGTLEGEILREEGGKIILKTRFGVVPVEKSRVERVEKRLTAQAEYAGRLKALEPDDAEARYQLALFCKKNGLVKEEKELYRAVLAIDDQHSGANEASGNVEYEGRWMTPSARDKAVAAAEAEGKRASGLVEHDGQWVTPEEKSNLEKGLVKHDGRWMTPEQVKRAQGFVPYKGGWIKKDELTRRKLIDFYGEILQTDVEVAISPHFVVAGTFKAAQLEEIADLAEQAHEQFRQIFGLEPAVELFRGAEIDGERTRCHIVYTKRALDYGRIVDMMRERYPQDVEEARAAYMKGQSGFYHVYPSCYVAGSQFPNTFEQVKASVVHKASHVMLMRYRYRSGFYPWWLIEGLGTYQELSALGHCDTFCTREGGYAANEDAAKNKWVGLARWKDIAKQQVAGMGDRSLLNTSKAGLNELGFRDLAKCWSICEWLISRHPKKFVKLVDGLKGGSRFPDAVQRAFGKPHELIDKEWREYVRANY